MNALSLLKRDHDEVKKMLATLDETTERAIKTRGETFTKLRSELDIHETIEEEIFYPALKDHPKTKDIALEGYEEHHVVDTVMGEMLDLEVSDEHHIEEEETEMFRQARQVFDEAELQELGSRMEVRKAQLQVNA